MDLEEIEKRIAAQYKILGFDKAYSFLYTGRSTFTPAQKFMFVGLNPGGGDGDYQCLIAGPEGTNSYLDEDWIEKPGQQNAGKHALQVQLKIFFETLCKELEIKEWEKYMRDTLCLNYIPFRSKNWQALGKRDKVIEFANELWADILRYIQPQALLVIDNNIRENLTGILEASGWTHDVESSCSENINWGNNKYYLDYFNKETGAGTEKMLIAKLPHLSSRKIFSRKECQGPREKVVKEIAKALRDYSYKRIYLI